MKIMSQLQMQNKIISLEKVVFQLLKQLNDIEKCESCSCVAKDLNEQNLIKDTGLCTDCYQTDYEEGVK